MDVSLLHAEGLPEVCVLSVRAGTTRRQASVDGQQPFRLWFPKGPPTKDPVHVKVDLLSALGSVGFEIRPGAEEYPATVKMRDGAIARLTFRFRENAEGAHGTAVAVDSGAPPPAGACSFPSAHGEGTLSSARRHITALEARAYLDEHDLFTWIQGLLQNLIHDRPSNPWDYIDTHTAAARKSRGPLEPQCSPDICQASMPCTPAPEQSRPAGMASASAEEGSNLSTPERRAPVDAECLKSRVRGTLEKEAMRRKQPFSVGENHTTKAPLQAEAAELKAEVLLPQPAAEAAPSAATAAIEKARVTEEAREAPSATRAAPPVLEELRAQVRLVLAKAYEDGRLRHNLTEVLHQQVMGSHADEDSACSEAPLSGAPPDVTPSDLTGLSIMPPRSNNIARVPPGHLLPGGTPASTPISDRRSTPACTSLGGSQLVQAPAAGEVDRSLFAQPQQRWPSPLVVPVPATVPAPVRVPCTPPLSHFSPCPSETWARLYARFPHRATAEGIGGAALGSKEATTAAADVAATDAGGAGGVLGNSGVSFMVGEQHPFAELPTSGLTTPQANEQWSEVEGVDIEGRKTVAALHIEVKHGFTSDSTDGRLTKALTEEWVPVQEAVERIVHDLPPLPRVCILGGTSLNDPDTAMLLKSVARSLEASLSNRIVILTGGMKGVQESLVKGLTDFPALVHLLPFGQASGFSIGKDVVAGTSLEERQEIFGQVGQVYLTFEGGPGVAKEAKAAFERGAVVLPFASTGGASSGMHDFPAGALMRPGFATTEQWACLQEKGSPWHAASVVVDIISNLLATAKVGAKESCFAAYYCAHILPTSIVAQTACKLFAPPQTHQPKMEVAPVHTIKDPREEILEPGLGTRTHTKEEAADTSEDLFDDVADAVVPRNDPFIFPEASVVDGEDADADEELRQEAGSLSMSSAKDGRLATALPSCWQEQIHAATPAPMDTEIAVLEEASGSTQSDWRMAPSHGSLATPCVLRRPEPAPEPAPSNPDGASHATSLAATAPVTPNVPPTADGGGRVNINGDASASSMPMGAEPPAWVTPTEELAVMEVVRSRSKSCHQTLSPSLAKSTEKVDLKAACGTGRVTELEAMIQQRNERLRTENDALRTENARLRQLRGTSETASSLANENDQLRKELRKLLSLDKDKRIGNKPGLMKH